MFYRIVRQGKQAMIEPISCEKKPLRFTGQSAVVIKESSPSSLNAMPDSDMRSEYADQIKQIDTKREAHTIKPEHYQQFAINPYAKTPQPGQFVDESR